MKRSILLVILIMVVGMVTGCANQATQFGLRGYPNAPHQRVQPLYVDQNVIWGMSDAQLTLHERKLNIVTDYNRKLIRNDGAAANVAKSWTNSNKSYQNDNFGRIARDTSRTLSNEISNAISDSIRGWFD